MSTLSKEKAPINDAVGRLFVLAAKEIPDTAEMLDALRRAGNLAEAIQSNIFSESQGQAVLGLTSALDVRGALKP
jgi:hypothetical protein